jgi:uncharacterized protein
VAIRLDNSFTVRADRPTTWQSLLDVPLVVSCMPGAELTDAVSESEWKTKLTVKVGPMTLVFAADLERTELDVDAGRMVITSKARELKGRGGATARMEVGVVETDTGSRVDIGTDVGLSGTAAQFGRPVVQDVARRLVESFAACLQAKLEAGAAGGPALARGTEASPATGTKPVSGLSLLLRALLRPVTRLFDRGRPS